LAWLILPWRLSGCAADACFATSMVRFQSITSVRSEALVGVVISNDVG
jgi:hypothetical protein